MIVNCTLVQVIMPIQFKQQLQPEGVYGVWDIQESEQFFQSNLPLFPVELAQVRRIKGEGRRLEWWASRYLLHVLSERTARGACIKDEFGKPHLEDSNYEISLSHSNRKAAVIAAPRLVGIDIQKLVPKIERIACKFMSDQDMATLSEQHRIEHLHVYWGAKEALYKAYGKKALEFKQHIRISPFTYIPQGGDFLGKVQKADTILHFRLTYERKDADMLVYAVEV